MTEEGDSWIHASSGHPASEVERVETASEVERDKHKVERETKKVNERDKKEIEYDQTDTLGWATNKAGTSSITAALDQGQLEALADDDRGAGSGERATRTTAFVADRILLHNKMARQDSQDSEGYTHSCSKQVIIPADGNEIVGTRFLVLGESMYISSYIYIYIYLYIHTHVCTHTHTHTRARAHTHTHTHTHTHHDTIDERHIYIISPLPMY